MRQCAECCTLEYKTPVICKKSRQICCASDDRFFSFFSSLGIIERIYCHIGTTSSDLNSLVVLVTHASFVLPWSSRQYQDERNSSLGTIANVLWIISIRNIRAIHRLCGNDQAVVSFRWPYGYLLICNNILLLQLWKTWS